MPINNLTPAEVEELIQLVIARLKEPVKKVVEPKEEEEDEPERKRVFGRHSK